MAADPLRLFESVASRVRDPASGRGVRLSGVARDVRMDTETLVVVLAFGAAHAVDDRRGIASELRSGMAEAGFAGEIRFEIREESADPPSEPVPGFSHRGVVTHGGPLQKVAIPGVKHVLLVASGKGGVGKSTVAANLAVALRRRDLAVGLLDADVYGPSVPRIMDARSRPMVDDRRRIVPINSYGVRCLSSGMLLGEEDPVIWRGPMVMDLLRRFVQETVWGGLDVLVVDLPPGTGDAQLTLVQGAELAGAVVVTTPQPVALADAVRGVAMFRKLGIPILGVVENMAWYELPDGSRDYVFGEGGGERLARDHGVPLLSQLPLRTALRKSADQGIPAALGDDATGLAFRDLAAKVWALLEGSRAP